MYTIRESKQAQRALMKIQPKKARQIRAKLCDIAAAPYEQHNNVTALQGREGYRLRVGDWRVTYTLNDNVLILLVAEVQPRGSAYKH